MLKNFPVYNSVWGRYESSQTENGKNHFRAEFGAVSSCVKFVLPFQGEPTVRWKNVEPHETTYGRWGAKISSLFLT